MRRRFRLNIIKTISESVLIFFSVILAFYFENKRQDWTAENKLISDLKELRESVADDTTVFLNIRRHYIPGKDSLDRETLDLIKKGDRVYYILQGLWGSEQLNYQNWTVKRMLDGDELNNMDKGFRNEIWEYNRTVNNILNGSMSIIKENDKKILNTAFSELKYKDEFSKIYGLGDDQPLIRYREYKDSSIVYSDKLKALFVYNLTALQSLRYELFQHRGHAEVVINLIDKKIKELE